MVCADQNTDADADLLIKYQSKVNGWGVEIMDYVHKILLKETKSLLDLCGSDSHQALQQLHLKFNLIHVRYQTDQCNKVPVQENDMIEEYTNSYQWYQINKAPVLVLKHDMFISNMKRYNEVHCTILLEQMSSDKYIADQYQKEPFFNFITSLFNFLERTSSGQARSFHEQSQTNVHSVTRHEDHTEYDVVLIQIFFHTSLS